MLLIFGATSLNSCKSDPCEDVSCVNGTCNDDGACLCDNGYEGTLCDQKICNDENCEFGECVNGACECDQGFTGDDCRDEIPPKAIRIKQIIITDFAEDNDGAPWDQDTAAPKPDLTVEFYKEEGVELFKTLDNRAEAEKGNRYVFDVDINIGNIAVNHNIRLYDSDNNSSNDFMDQATFNMWKDVARGSRFASETPELTTESGNTKFVFAVEYEYAPE